MDCSLLAACLSRVCGTAGLLSAPSASVAVAAALVIVLRSCVYTNIVSSLVCAASAICPQQEARTTPEISISIRTTACLRNNLYVWRVGGWLPKLTDIFAVILVRTTRRE